MLRTIRIVVGGGDGPGETAVTPDYGDYLLSQGKIDSETYERKQREAKELLGV